MKTRLAAMIYVHECGVASGLAVHGMDNEPHHADGETRIACRQGVLSLVEHLIARGAALEQPHAVTGSTALHSAANANQPHVVQMLVERGAQLEARARYGATPLMLASCRGHLSVVRLLLDAGARADAKDENGMSASMHARAASRRGVLAVLKGAVKRGAPRNVDA